MEDSLSWNDICVLTRLNVNQSFQPFSSPDLHLFLPDVVHIIVLLLGVGDLSMRQTTHHLAVNTVHSLARTSNIANSNGEEWQAVLQKLNSTEIQACFRLSMGSSGVDSIKSTLPSSIWVTLSSSESIVRLFERVMMLAASSDGELEASQSSLRVDQLNQWRARWMGLIASTCFQHNPATQTNAFVVLGILASDEVDDDLIYQVLVVLGMGLSSLRENDALLLASMVKALANMTSGLPPQSRYHSALFWLSVAILETGYIQLFPPALELLAASFKSVSRTTSTDVLNFFGTARPASSESLQLDQTCGVSFETDFEFALTAVILKGSRHPLSRPLAIEVMQEILRTSRSSVPNGHRALIPAGNVPLFVALLPHAVHSEEAVRTLFQSVGVDLTDTMKSISDLPVFGLLDIP